MGRQQAAMARTHLFFQPPMAQAPFLDDFRQEALAIVIDALQSLQPFVTVGSDMPDLIGHGGCKRGWNKGDFAMA